MPSIGMGRNKVPRRDQVELYPFAPACSLEMEQRGVCKLSDLTHWKLGQTREETGSVQMGNCSKCDDSVWRPKLKATWEAPNDMVVLIGPAERRCGCAACPKDRILLKVLFKGSFGPPPIGEKGYSRRRMDSAKWQDSPGILTGSFGECYSKNQYWKVVEEDEDELGDADDATWGGTGRRRRSIWRRRRAARRRRSRKVIKRIRRRRSRPIRRRRSRPIPKRQVGVALLGTRIAPNIPTTGVKTCQGLNFGPRIVNRFADADSRNMYFNGADWFKGKGRGYVDVKCRVWKQAFCFTPVFSTLPGQSPSRSVTRLAACAVVAWSRCTLTILLPTVCSHQKALFCER